ncbi:MAG: hypothetical protein M3343_03525 [Actinomycetota bacterium]|nr:hypothetical protein [Actinomycetota bacterium]
MIELEMVRHMVKRGLLLTPVVVLAALVLAGPEGAASAALGLAITIVNLWVGGRILGGLAENRPELLLPGAMVALVLAFVATGGALFALQRLDFIDFPVTAITLVGSHLALVTWEAADRLLRLPAEEKKTPTSDALKTRS